MVKHRRCAGPGAPGASEWAFARAGRRIDRAVADSAEPRRRWPPSTTRWSRARWSCPRAARAAGCGRRRGTVGAPTPPDRLRVPPTPSCSTAGNSWWPRCSPGWASTPCWRSSPTRGRESRSLNPGRPCYRRLTAACCRLGPLAPRSCETVQCGLTRRSPLRDRDRDRDRTELEARPNPGRRSSASTMDEATTELEQVADSTARPRPSGNGGNRRKRRQPRQSRQRWPRWSHEEPPAQNAARGDQFRGGLHVLDGQRRARVLDRSCGSPPPAGS